MFILFDTETTNLPNKNLALNHPEQARICQLAALVLDKDFNEVASMSSLVKPDDWVMSSGAQERHHIPIEQCEKEGRPISDVLIQFDHMCKDTTYCVGHSIKFDLELIRIEYALKQAIAPLPSKQFCTMLNTTNICKLKGRWPKSYKWLKLSEAYEFFFNEKLEGAHDALIDIRATARIFKHLVNNKLVQLI